METAINQQLNKIKKKLPQKVCYTSKNYVAVIDKQGKHCFRDDYKPLNYVIPVKLNTVFVRQQRLENRKKIAAVILQSFNFIGIPTKKQLKTKILCISGFKIKQQ